MQMIFMIWMVLLAENEERGRQILERANEAMLALDTVSFQFEYRGTGSLTGAYFGEAVLQRSIDLPKARFRVRLKPRTEGLADLEMAKDGNKLTLLDHRQKRFHTGSFNQGNGHLWSMAYYAIWFNFFNKEPFAAELNAKAFAYLGTRDVDGVLCEGVRVRWNRGVYGTVEADWFFGKDDYLPRAQTQRNLGERTAGTFQYKLSNLNQEPKDATFQLLARKDYQVKREDVRKLKIGDVAPDWVLTDEKGLPVRLKDMRGEIVVMDFWASWCPPCWRAMPALAELARELKGQPIRFLAINTWESGNVDPAAYMQRHDFPFQLLTHGERIALDYKLGTLPALFAIDEQGKFLFTAPPGTMASIARLKQILMGNLKD